MSFDEVTCVGVDRKSVDVVTSIMTSHCDAAEFHERRRSTTTDRVEQSDWHGRLARRPRTQVEQAVAGLRDAQRRADQLDDVR